MQIPKKLRDITQENEMWEVNDNYFYLVPGNPVECTWR